MESFFKGNLALIKNYNKELAKKLENAPLRSFELNTNLAGEYNLILDSKPVHSVTGAQAEADEIFKNIGHDTRNDIHVLYGMGLGYLFDKFALNAKGDVVLFEPDLELLRFVFEIIDMRELLQRPNVFVASDFEELRAICTSLYRYKRKITTTALDFYKSSRHEKLNAFHAYLKNLYEELYRNHYYQTNRMQWFLPEMLKSLNFKAKLPLFQNLSGKFNAVPAVIVSAGPSLAENLEVLKKNRNKVLIFAVGTALKVLLDNGIVPDFVNYIETHSSKSFFDGIDTEKLNLIAEPCTAEDVFERKFKNIFLTTSYESNVNHLFAQICGFELPYFEGKGTVAYQALYAAKIAGCSPIVLLGQDLAYTDGQCYAKGSIYEDLKCVASPDGCKIEVKDREKLKKAFYSSWTDKTDAEKEAVLNKTLENLNSSLCTVKDVLGRPVPTSAEYKNFISFFEYFALQNKGIKLYNASNGADIRGFEHKSAQEIFDGFSLRVDISSILDNLHCKPCATGAFHKNLEKNYNDVKNAARFLKEFQLYANSENADIDGLIDRFEKYKTIRNSSLINSILTLRLYNETEFLLRDNAKFDNPQRLMQVLKALPGDGLYYAALVLNNIEENLRSSK